MTSAQIMWLDARVEVTDLHYVRRLDGTECLCVGAFDPAALDRWNAKKVGPPPVLFERDFSSSNDWRRTVQAAIRSDMADALVKDDTAMKFKAPEKPAGMDVEMSLPPGRADRVKP